MPMMDPPHPGRIVRQECIEPLGLSATDAAKALGVSRNALSELVNERCGISPEMAIRIAKAFGISATVWAGLQLDYDMAQAMKHADRIKVRRCQRNSGLHRVMAKTERFSAERYLSSPESQAELLNDALASGDADYVAHALAVIARARNASEVASTTGPPPNPISQDLLRNRQSRVRRKER